MAKRAGIFHIAAVLSTSIVDRLPRWSYTAFLAHLEATIIDFGGSPWRDPIVVAEFKDGEEEPERSVERVAAGPAIGTHWGG